MVTKKAVYALRLVALVGLVAGCAPTGSTQTNASTPPVQPSSQDPGPSPDGPGPKPQAPKTGQEQVGKDDGRKKKPINSSRIYQLNDLEIVKIKIGKTTFKTWVMDTMSKQQEGLMHVTDAEIDSDEAMIFVYNTPRQMNFWMRNTRIPLDIAYVNTKKVILNIAQMKPFDESPVPSKGIAQYAIEFKQGTCKKFGIRAGMSVEIPSSVKNAEGD